MVSCDSSAFAHHGHKVFNAKAMGKGQVKSRGELPFVALIHEIGVLAHMIIAVVRQNVEYHAPKGLFNIGQAMGDRQRCLGEAVIIDAWHMGRCFQRATKTDQKRFKPGALPAQQL